MFGAGFCKSKRAPSRWILLDRYGRNLLHVDTHTHTHTHTHTSAHTHISAHTHTALTPRSLWTGLPGAPASPPPAPAPPRPGTRRHPPPGTTSVRCPRSESSVAAGTRPRSPCIYGCRTVTFSRVRKKPILPDPNRT